MEEGDSQIRWAVTLEESGVFVCEKDSTFDGSEDEGRLPQTKECRQHLEARKGKETYLSKAFIKEYSPDAS